jgi:hypothetical protein
MKDIQILKVDRLLEKPMSVVVDVKGITMRFIRICDGSIVEVSRTRDSQIYDADNYYMTKKDYAQIKKQVMTIFMEGK